jgi:hypothetical protein
MKRNISKVENSQENAQPDQKIKLEKYLLLKNKLFQHKP